MGEYVAEDDDAYHVLGGNEGDAVSIVRVAKHRLFACRRPIWAVSQPTSVIPHHVAPNGVLSTDEG